MRRKQSSLGILLLVVVLGLLGLVGCSRQAQVREEQSAEPTPTIVVQATPGSENVAPVPGETVVSAVSPTQVPNTPVAGEESASASSSGQAPTAEPVAPTEPAVDPTATQAATASAAATEAEVTPDSQAPVSSGDGQSVIHKVKKGETLSGIALRYGTTTRAIAKANGISDRGTIIPGQELKIQASGDSSAESSSSSGDSGNGDGQASDCRKMHKVKKGEWVWQIAKKYDVKPKKIMKANNLTSRKAKTLQPGTKLCIP